MMREMQPAPALTVEAVIWAEKLPDALPGSDEARFVHYFRWKKLGLGHARIAALAAVYLMSQGYTEKQALERALDRHYQGRGM